MSSAASFTAWPPQKKLDPGTYTINDYLQARR